MGDSFASNDRDGGVQPSVTRDKWVRHAIDKMTRGYCIIVNPDRKSACFYLQGKGYEGCPAKAARQLISEGLVVEGGRHPLGTIWLLDPAALNRASQPPTRTPFSKKHRFAKPAREGNDSRPERDTTSPLDSSGDENDRDHPGHPTGD